MSFGKLYTHEANTRSFAIRAVAKANNIDLEIVDTKPGQVSADYKLLNKLGKIPTFEGADDYILSECIAIAIYITSQNEKTTLLGKTKKDYASILRWMSFSNSEVLPKLSGWVRPLKGMGQYNKKNVDDSAAAANVAMKTFDDHLLVNTYLVGERLTLADLFCTGELTVGFLNVFDAKWREEYPNVTRWYQTIYNQPIFSDIAAPISLVDEAIKYTPPKKEEKPKEAAKPKEAPKPKAAAKEADDEEDEAPAAPKAKHPLEALGRSEFVLDDWKRKYSNEDTRPVALPWFWENMNFKEFSLYRIDYNYNDELTQVFMTSNLIGGFFNRLEASRKYLFGAASVYGQSNDSVIRGAFLVRGQEAIPAFDVAPDYESYTFTKLDPTSAEDKEFVDSMWAWDKPIEVKGKSYDWADGKVFK